MRWDVGELLNLPPTQKLELIEALWNSLVESAADLPVPHWQREELERREAEHCETPDAVVSWETAKVQILDERD